jgi:hypothetical protein
MAGESQDQSHLDRKYFIDSHIYNCPFCNRRHVAYEMTGYDVFNWANMKQCWVYFVRCRSCLRTSMHLSYDKLLSSSPFGEDMLQFKDELDLDSLIFYSVPTSFFVMDERIPRIIRELIAEAEGSLKMNFLTGASACMRKAIYELLLSEKAEGEHYEDKIKSLKTKYPDSDPVLFEILGHIQGMTSDKVHEQSWPKWDSKNLTLIIETLKAVLHDIYVAPRLKADRSKRIGALLKEIKGPNPS